MPRRSTREASAPGPKSFPANAGVDDLITCSSTFFGALAVDGYAAIGDNALALTHIGDPGFNIHPNDDGYAAIAKAHRLVERSL
jgi:hypothetical protein